jgi:hypothetical protein
VARHTLSVSVGGTKPTAMSVIVRKLRKTRVLPAPDAQRQVRRKKSQAAQTIPQPTCRYIKNWVTFVCLGRKSYMGIVLLNPPD